MQCDVTLKGFDAGTYKTDHLVKWIWAPCQDMVERWIDALNLREHVDSVTEVHNGHSLTFADGIDVILTGHGAVEVAPGIWQTLAPHFSLEDWIAASIQVRSERHEKTQ